MIFTIGLITIVLTISFHIEDYLKDKKLKEDKKNTFKYILKDIINMENFIFAIIIFIAIFILLGFNIVFKESKNQKEVLTEISGTFGPIFTGLITVWVLRKTIKSNEILQTKLVKIEEDNLFRDIRTTAEFTYFNDDVSLNKNIIRYNGSMLIKNKNYKKILESLNANEQIIIYAAIHNIGNNPMYDVGIYFYKDKYGENLIDDLVYKHRYLKDDDTLIIPIIEELDDGELSNAYPPKVLLKFTTGLIGKCEEISMDITYSKENDKDKSNLNIKTVREAVDKNSEQIYDSAEIHYLNKDNLQEL